MDPLAQIWRDRLNCTVSKVDALFEDALGRAQQVMDEDALYAWLAGTDVVCALGRGLELPLYYLDEMPEVVKHSDAAILPEVADLCVLLSKEAVRDSIGPFLSTLAQVARRLDNADLLRIWLRMIRKMVAEAKGGTAPLLARAPYLFAQLSLLGVQEWVEYGMRVYRDYPHRLPDYFSLQSADSKAMLVKQRSGTLFMDAERQLTMFQRAFFNTAEDFRPYSEALETARKPKPHYDQQGLHIPDVYEDLGTVSGINRYYAVIAHMLAHQKWTTPLLADNFSVFQHIAIEVFEDARVEHLAMQQYPGLRKLWVSLHPIPVPGSCPSGWACIRHKLAMLSYAILNPEHRYTEPSLLEFAAKFRARFMESPHDPKLAVDLGVGWLAKNFEHDFRQPNVWFEDTEVSYRDDNRYLWMFLEEAEEEDDFHSDHGAQARVEGEDNGLLPPRFYPEWDYQLQSYRPDWVTVFESLAEPGNAAEIDALLEKNQRLLKQLKAIVDLLKPQQRKRVRYQNEGDDLDLDVAIQAAIDYRIGRTPDTRIMQSHVKDGRDIAVMLLLDLSESINDVPAGAESSILQLSQEAAALLATSVEALGDPLAIGGFSSNTRNAVSYSHFKGFKEPWGEAPKARLAGMKARNSTRMGAALRHAGAYLADRKEEKRLLLVLTDGEPHDIDVADPKYLQDDTRIAVGELASKGVTTYCISLDPNADDYVADIFGRNNFTVIDRVESLPEKLPKLFMSLTR
ncbi:MAG: VWA domain-containing protein [Rhodobacteraceae bacterium]|nr:VWA domain-containing protein [Paracoccaceae bacterium]